MYDVTHHNICGILIQTLLISPGKCIPLTNTQIYMISSHCLIINLDEDQYHKSKIFPLFQFHVVKYEGWPSDSAGLHYYISLLFSLFWRECGKTTWDNIHKSIPSIPIFNMQQSFGDLSTCGGHCAFNSENMNYWK